jgi:CheY-like chemotaxis protein
VRSKRDKSPLVLVVEDQPTIRELAESVIKTTLRYKTLSAATAREAVALFEQNSIDLLFTDIGLPDGPDAMDGLELARKAVDLRPGLRVIYTSGGARTDGMDALFVDGSVFLAKPYTVDRLIEAVKTALGS